LRFGGASALACARLAEIARRVATALARAARRAGGAGRLARFRREPATPAVAGTTRLARTPVRAPRARGARAHALTHADQLNAARCSNGSSVAPASRIAALTAATPSRGASIT